MRLHEPAEGVLAATPSFVEERTPAAGSVETASIVNETGPPAQTHRTVASWLGQLRAAAGALELGPSALLLQAPFPSRTRRLGGAPAAPRAKRGGDSLAQPGKGELAVACLAAAVLGDRGHAWAEAGPERLFLLAAQRLRGVDVEHGLDSRGGDVCVLSSGSRRAAGAQLDLGVRDVDQLASTCTCRTCTAPRPAPRCRRPARGSAR
jgi:hypothetical protein